MTRPIPRSAPVTSATRSRKLIPCDWPPDLHASLSACRTRRGGGTSCQLGGHQILAPSSRCARVARGRATGTSPRGRPARACTPRGVVDDAVLERERAHARRFTRSRRHVRAINGESLWIAELAAGIHRAEVVLDDSRLLLFLGERRLEVVVEVAPERRRPGEAEAHPPLERLQLRERRARDRPEHHVVVGQVDDEPVEAVRDRRAGRTPRRVVGPEHEVVDEELRAPSEEVCSEALPSSVSKRYSLSIRTHGSSCRRRASSSLRRVTSFSASSSSSRAASHSLRVPVSCFVIALPSLLSLRRGRQPAPVGRAQPCARRVVKADEAGRE